MAPGQQGLARRSAVTLTPRRHLNDAVRAGDTLHEQAHREMKGRWKHPVASMGWYRDTKKAFAALPED